MRCKAVHEWFWMLVGSAIATAACGEATGPKGGSETHLSDCNVDGECASGETCVKGRCEKTPPETTDSGKTGAGGMSGTGGGSETGGSGGLAGADAVAGGAGTAGADSEIPGVPPRPASTDVQSDVELPALTSVMRTIDWGDSEPNPENPPTRYRDLGFNLDGVTTIASDRTVGACALPSWASGVVDGPGGIDNSAGEAVQRMRNIIVTYGSTNMTAGIEGGDRTLLVRIPPSWNGQANDDRVTVDLFAAAPFTAAMDCVDQIADGGMECPAPAWDGSDTWPIDGSSVVSRDIDYPIARDGAAYVTDSRLVARFPLVSWTLTARLSTDVAPSFVVTLWNAVLVCDIGIVDTPARGPIYALRNCTLGGRWHADNWLRQLWKLPDPSAVVSGSPLCTSSPLYDTFKRSICGGVDVNSSGGGGTCDSLSVGLRFDTYPASLGNIVGVTSAENPCEESPWNPRGDSCSTIN